VLITLGLLFLMEIFIPDFYFRHLWPLLLIVIGVVLVVHSLISEGEKPGKKDEPAQTSTNEPPDEEDGHKGVNEETDNPEKNR